MRKLLFLTLLLLALAASAHAELYPAFDGESGLWGYIDETGAWAIPPQYEGANHFHGGCAIVSMAEDKDASPGQQGIIDEKGAYLLAPSYIVHDCVDEGAGGICIVYDAESGLMGFFNIPNRFFSGLRWDECYAAHDTTYVLIYSNDGTAGLADRATGEVVLPMEYAATGLYDWSIEGNFVVASRADSWETELIEIGVGAVELPEDVYLESPAVSDNLVAFARNEDDLMGYLNTAGDIVIPAQFQYAESFWDGYASVVIGEGEVGVIDRTGRVILRHETERMLLPYLGRVGDMLAIQWDDGEFGLIHPDGTVICRHALPEVSDVFLYEVAPDGPLWLRCRLSDMEYAWALVSRTGEMLTDPIWQHAGSPSSLYADGRGWQAVGSEDGLWGFVDAYGSEVIPFQFAYAEPFSGNLARVEWPDGREGYIGRDGQTVYAWEAE